MNRATLAEILRLLRDCQSMDDSALALLVRRTTRGSRLGRAARAVTRRREASASAVLDLAALADEANFSLGG